MSKTSVLPLYSINNNAVSIIDVIYYMWTNITSGVKVFDTVSNSIDTLKYRRVSIFIFVVSILSIPPIWQRLAQT